RRSHARTPTRPTRRSWPSSWPTCARSPSTPTRTPTRRSPRHWPGDPVNSYLESLFSLEGRTAIVTGGSSGIGRGIAAALARAGASTVVLARGHARVDHTVRELGD